MDLAQSILQELLTLQKKNEELVRIIGKLEQESDVIIRQFEHKIEELQNGLKHEQDDKARASRRYEAEIRDLEGTKDALIKEIAEVRDTYQARIHQLDEKIGTLTQSIETREKEYIEIRVEKERIIADLQQDNSNLQARLIENAEASGKEITSLNSQFEAVKNTLDSERALFKDIIYQKDDEIRSIKSTLTATSQRLYEGEEREKIREEQTRNTFDHLNNLLHTERLIRNRELKERDEQVREYEGKLKAADERINQTREQSDAEISRLNQLNAEYILQITRLQDENKHFTSVLAGISAEYDQKLKSLGEKHEEEKKNLQYSLALLTREIESGKKMYAEELRIRDEERVSLNHTINELNETCRNVQNAREHVEEELTQRISALESEKELLAGKLEKVLSDHSDLTAILNDYEIRIEQERSSLNVTIENLRTKYDEAELIHLQEITKSRESYDQLLVERDQISAAKQEREEYFRNEISGLHEEIDNLQTHMIGREEELLKDITLRDTQIVNISTNNEALRGEIDRIRGQYIRLQETIRAEKDESVHALYREITSLEDQLTGKETEISTLTEKVLRLDAENTRLLQTVSQTTSPVPPVAPASRSEKDIEKSDDTPVPVLDHRKREVIALAADLEDPSRAPEAAEKLAGMGSSVVDLLIPLLHTGSIQKRVWIAVVLYELNDNRATLPLMKLLETPKVHFRELIWEAKNQYRTRVRMKAGPAEPVGVRTGPLWP